MPNVHVNSTSANPAATPTSPYDTWEKAATTHSAAAAVAVAGDTVYVHPSHTESNGGSCTWAGTHTNPIKILCGTPDQTAAPNSVGISALQTTAEWITTTTTQTWSGSVYVYGLAIKITGSSAVESRINSTVSHVQYLENCDIANQGSGGQAIRIGPFTAGGEALTILKNCRVRCGAAVQTFVHSGRVIWLGGSVIVGGTTPNTFVSLGVVSAGNGAIVEISGFDFSNWANTFDLVATAARTGRLIARNCKFPSGWGVTGSTGVPTAADFVAGNEVKLLNWGDGDTNYRFWVEDRQGIARDETTVKRTGGASDGTTSYSMRCTTLANVSYPNNIFRSPPIIQRVDVTSPPITRQAFVQIVSDGATPFTDKEVWVEYEYLGTNNFPLAVLVNDRAAYLAAAAAQTASSETWTGFTDGVTTGPNGTMTWNKQYLYQELYQIYESGYVIATVCMAVPSKTIYVDPVITITT